MSDAAQPGVAQPGEASGHQPPAQPNPEPVAPQVAPTAVPSVDSTNFVEKSRFDGLMAAYQKTLADLQAAKTAPPAAPAPANPAPAVPAEPAHDPLSQRVAELEAMLLGQQIEAAKQQAVTKHPEIAPLADFLVGETPEDIMELATALAERLNPATPGTEPPAEPDPSQPPVTPGAPPFTSPALGDDELEALKDEARAKRPGSFGKLLNALYARQNSPA